MAIAKMASRNVAFKSDKLMDALFQEGQSAPQTPQTLFDADFEGWPATPSCISLIIRKIVRNRLVLVGLGLFGLRLGICNGICCVK